MSSYLLAGSGAMYAGLRLLCSGVTPAAGSAAHAEPMPPTPAARAAWHSRRRSRYMDSLVIWEGWILALSPGCGRRINMQISSARAVAVRSEIAVQCDRGLTVPIRLHEQ